MFCKHCGAEVPDVAKFCPKCGGTLTPIAEAPNPQAAPQASPQEDAPAPGTKPYMTPKELFKGAKLEVKFLSKGKLIVLAALLILLLLVGLCSR